MRLLSVDKLRPAAALESLTVCCGSTKPVLPTPAGAATTIVPCICLLLFLYAAVSTSLRSSETVTLDYLGFLYWITSSTVIR